MADNERTRKKAAIKRATAVSQRDATRLDSQALKELKSHYKAALAGVREELSAVADQQNVIRMERLGQLKNRLNDHLSRLDQAQGTLLRQIMQRSAEIGVGPWEKHIGISNASAAMDRALLTARTFTANDGLQLSDRLWNISDHNRDVVSKSVQQAVIRGYDASRAAAEFLERGMSVPADLQKLQNQANATTLSRTIGRDLMTGDGNPYENARRVFRTEINRAYGLAYQNSAFEDDDVVGTRFMLSPNHRHRDICDMHASVNRYGLGRGVYPQGKSPWPAHPNTLSFEQPVFADEVTDEDAAGKEDRISWLQKQPYDVQVAVLRSQKKAAALNGGVLKESQIATPWKALAPRFARQGIDVDALKPLPKPKADIPAAVYQPAGEPVSSAIQASGYKAVTQRTVDAIDKVHGDGRLPVIPVKRSGSTKFNGAYRYYTGGDPVDIKISSMGDHKELTLAHEIGHFLDHQGIGTVGEHASKSHRLFDQWRDAVAGTDAINQLLKMFDGPGEVAGYRVQKKYISYLLQTHEIWARSYAQYIATRSGDYTLLQQLKVMQERQIHAAVGYTSQWQDEDFEPVAKAIDKLFEELGWLHGR